MKRKILSLVLVVTMIIAALASLASCGIGAKGTDAARILLARERMNEGGFSSLFDELFGRNTAALDIEYERSMVAKLMSETIGEATPAESTSTLPTGVYHEWKESLFSDFSGNMESFDNLVTDTDRMIEDLSEQITLMKKNVGVTGKWVSSGFFIIDNMLLEVSEGKEILYFNDSQFPNDYKIGIRETDDQARSVYTIYSYLDYEEQGSGRIKTVAIPGEYYESSFLASNGFSHHMIAEKSRGYWSYQALFAPVYSPSTGGMNYSVVDGDYAYEIMFIPDSNGNLDPYSILIYDVVKRNDILTIADFNVQVCLGAITKGLDSIRAYGDAYTRTEVTEHVGNTFYLPRSEELHVLLSDGRVLAPGDGTEKLQYIGTHINANQTKKDAYFGSISFAGRDVSYLPRHTYVELIYEALDELGLGIVLDKEKVLEVVAIAEAIGDNHEGLVEYCGIPINTTPDISASIEILEEEFNTHKDMYNTALTYPKASGSTFVNARFAPLAGYNDGEVSYSDGRITVDGMSLTLTDTTLLEVGVKYGIRLGVGLLVDGKISAANVLPLGGGEGGVAFESGALALTMSGEYTLPDGLDAGEYVIVAYAATEDGIRVSEIATVGFVSADEDELEREYMNVEVRPVDGKLHVTYKIATTIYATIEKKDSYTKEDLLRAMKSAALKVGYIKPDAVLTDMNGGEVADGATIGAGTYSLSAYAPSGNGVAEISILLVIE